MIPNVKFEINRNYNNENDPTQETNIKLSLYEQTITKKDNFTSDQENLLFSQNFLFKPDQFGSKFTHDQICYDKQNNQIKISFS